METDLLAGVMVFVLAGTLIAKNVVNLFRMAVDLPRWAPPTLAFVVGVLGCFGLVVANSGIITAAVVAQCFLAGVFIAIAAIGDVQFQRKADDVDADRKMGVE